VKCQDNYFTTGLPCDHPALYWYWNILYNAPRHVCGLHARGIPKDRLTKLEKESKS